MLQQVSRLYWQKEKQCLDKELASTFELHCSHLWPDSYQPGYHDYNCILYNGVALEMVTATTNNLVLKFYKRCSKYIWDLHLNLTKKDVYNVMKGKFCSLLRNQVLTEMAIESDATIVLRVYQDILTYIRDKELQLLTLLLVKHSFTMSNTLIDKTASRV